jgi:fatty acid desaturase
MSRPVTKPPPAACLVNFSMREVRAIVGDLFVARPGVYWSDFLASLGLAYAALGWGATAPVGGFVWTAATVVGVLVVYRAVLFIHEVVHFRAGMLPGFSLVWNALCGIPFFVPSFLYTNHAAHHTRRFYGTSDDGEYLPLGRGPRWRIVGYVLQSLVIPALGVLRLAVLTPLAWLSPALRRWVQRRASSLVIDPAYVRPLPSALELRSWRIQEAVCLVYAWTLFGLTLAGVVPWRLLAQAYLTAVGVITLNALRTLGAHRYAYEGRELSFLEQLLDSVNYPRAPLLAELWAPVGLRFHALHHLLPSLPYHALAAAHARLMDQLPADSPYRQTNSPSLRISLTDLWRRAGRPTAAPPRRTERPQHAAGEAVSSRA